MTTSLSDAFPNLVEEWDNEKNELPPSQYAAFSGKSVFWKCPKGHSYNLPIAKRTLRRAGCPYCSGRRVLKGFNDLATTNPELLDEWNNERNVEYTPTDITSGSNKKVWWRCKDCGHEWEAPISNRSRGSGCPNCRYKKSIPKRIETVLEKQGSLADKFPELLEEWDYEKNAGIASPDKISAMSTVNVHWKCKNCGNEWTAPVENRTRGASCLKCSYKNRQKSNRK